MSASPALAVLLFVAHTFVMERHVTVQPSDRAAILITVTIPRASELARVANVRELAETAVRDLLVLSDGVEASCTLDVRDRDRGALEIAVLMECDAGREWLVYTGGRVGTTLDVLDKGGACFGLRDDRLITWMSCP